MAKNQAKSERGKPEKSERKKKNGVAKKPSAEALSDEQFKKLLYMHVGKYKPALERKDEATKALKQILDAAKEDGIPKKDIELAIKLESGEGELDTAAEVKRIFRIARWAGTKIGTQLELFAKSDKKVDIIYEEGHRAGLRNEPGRVPAHHGQNAAQRWLHGHAAGLKELNELRSERFGGMRPLSETVADLTERAGEAGGFGSEPATHTETPATH